MNFVQKLIDDTNNGDWDFVWKYNDGSKTYTFNKTKHYLSGLNFSLENNNPLIIFPNGYGLKTDLLSELESAVLQSLERTVDTSIEMYMSGKELTPEEEVAQAEQEKNKTTKEKDITPPKSFPPDKLDNVKKKKSA
jgi:hypothetical protein